MTLIKIDLSITVGGPSEVPDIKNVINLIHLDVLNQIRFRPSIKRVIEHPSLLIDGSALTIRQSHDLVEIDHLRLVVELVPG